MPRLVPNHPKALQFINEIVHHQFWLPGFTSPLSSSLCSGLLELFGLLRFPLHKPREALTFYSLVDNLFR
jgi:hypothetical protein